MAAYIIVEVETIDEALMAEYRKHTPEAVAKFGGDRKSTRLNSSHSQQSRMPSSA